MARRDNLDTKKGVMVGNNVSHANNRTKKRFLPNLHWQRIFLEDQGIWIRVRLSKKSLRTIDKRGTNWVLQKLAS